jgi:excisionase family DNA binding protein
MTRPMKNTPNKPERNRRIIDLTEADLRELIADVALEYVEGQPQSAANDDGFLDRAGAAKFLRISLSKLDQLCRDSGLPFHLVGDSRRFERDELKAWVRGAK